MTKKTAQGSHSRRRVIGYSRVSTDAQGNSGVGLENQKAGIQAFADKMNWDLIEIFQDVATGMGPSSAKERMGLQRALSMANDNDALLLVYDWSRISRDNSSFEDIAKLLPDRDRIISVLQGTTLSEASAAGQHAYAQKQGEFISKSTKEGMAKKRAEGAVFGNPDIRGVQPSGAAAAEAKANTLSRRIADVLIEVGDETLTLAQIGEILNDRGILTGQGKPWNKSRIRVPLEKARAMIRNDEEKASDAHYKDNPLFGAF